MSKSNRNNPIRSESSDGTFSMMEFNEQFPDDAACLEWLKNRLYPNGIFCPKCQKTTKHHRVANRPSYSCQFCGHHEHPMRGTIFEDSATSLKLWFHAIFLMASTRCGISAKQIRPVIAYIRSCGATRGAIRHRFPFRRLSGASRRSRRARPGPAPFAPRSPPPDSRSHRK